MTSRNDLQSLVGEVLSAVSFVMDYVEFHFGGPCPLVRALTDPVLETPEASVTFGDPGSRDAFCSLIGQVVTDLSEKEDEAIVVSFASSQVLRIPLDKNSRVGPEAAHFVPELDAPIKVW